MKTPMFHPLISVCVSLILVLACPALVRAQAQTPPLLTVVGVLGNTVGMTGRPIPYAYYSGVAADSHGRLYLTGTDRGIPVVDQDGNLLAGLPIPDLGGMHTHSIIARSGDFLYFVATNGFASALYRIDCKSADVSAITVTKVASGPGHWAISPTLDPAGKVIVAPLTASATFALPSANVEPDQVSDVPSRFSAYTFP